MRRERSFFLFFIFSFYRCLPLLVVSSLFLLVLLSASSSFSPLYFVSVREAAGREDERESFPLFLYVDGLLMSPVQIEANLHSKESREEEERDGEEDELVGVRDDREDRRKDDRIVGEDEALISGDSQDVREKKQKKMKRQDKKGPLHKTAKKSSTRAKKEKEEEEQDDERRQEDGKFDLDSVDFKRTTPGEGDSLVRAEDSLLPAPERQDRREDNPVDYPEGISPSTVFRSLGNREADEEEGERQEGERNPVTSSRFLNPEEKEEQGREREIEEPIKDDGEALSRQLENSLMDRSRLLLPSSSSSPSSSVSKTPMSSDHPSSSSFSPEDSLSSLSVSPSSSLPAAAPAEMLSPTILLASRLLQEVQFVGSGMSVYLYGIVSRGFYITQEEVLKRLRENLSLLDFVERYQPQYGPSEAVLTHELSVWRSIIREFLQDEQDALSQQFQRHIPQDTHHPSYNDGGDTNLSSPPPPSISSSAFPSSFSSSLSTSASSSSPPPPPPVPLSFSPSSAGVFSSSSLSPFSSGEHVLEDTNRIESRRSSSFVSAAGLASSFSSSAGVVGEEDEERSKQDLIDRELEEELKEFTREEEQRGKSRQDFKEDDALGDAEAFPSRRVSSGGREKQFEGEKKEKKKSREVDEVIERDSTSASKSLRHQEMSSSFSTASIMPEKDEEEKGRREEEKEVKEEDERHPSRSRFSSLGGGEALPEEEHRDEMSMMNMTELKREGDYLHGNETTSIKKENEIGQASSANALLSSFSQGPSQFSPSVLWEGQEGVEGEEAFYEDQGDDEFVDEYLVSFRMTFRRCLCVLSRALVTEDHQELAWFYQTILPTLVFMARGWILILTSQYRRGVRTLESTEHELQKMRRQMSRLTTIDDIFISAIDDLNRKGNEDYSSPFPRRRKHIDHEEELLRPSGGADEDEKRKGLDSQRKKDRDGGPPPTSTSSSSSVSNTKDSLKSKQRANYSSTSGGHPAGKENDKEEEMPSDAKTKEKKKKKEEEEDQETKKTSTTTAKEVEKKTDGLVMMEDEDRSVSPGRKRRGGDASLHSRRKKGAKSTKKKKKTGTFIGSAIEYLKKHATNPWMIGLVTFASLVGLDHLARYRYYE